jgi:hypothetical protein
MSKTPRYAGKWVLLALAMAVIFSMVGLVTWTRSTPLVPDAAQRSRAKTPGVFFN